MHESKQCKINHHNTASKIMFNSFKIGQRVVFKDDSPDYASYKGHEFLIVDYLKDDDERQLTDFVKLRCETTSTVTIAGAIETSQLKLVSDVVESSSSFNGAGVVLAEVTLAVVAAGLEVLTSVL